MPGNPVSIGATREKPSARLMEAGLSTIAMPCWATFTRSPVSVVVSTIVNVFEGHGSKHRVPSTGSHAADSGVR
jgi:hypothetical protein